MTTPSLWRRIRNTLTHSRRKHIATIDVSHDGFVYKVKGRERRMAWAELSRIDAGVRNYLSFDALFVVMIAGSVKIEIGELDDGFRQFETTLFERWPKIRDSWNRLLTANPHEPQYETLWRRDERA